MRYSSTFFDRKSIGVELRTAIREDFNWLVANPKDSKNPFRMKIGFPYWELKEDERLHINWVRNIVNREEDAAFKEDLRQKIEAKKIFVLDLDQDKTTQTKFARTANG